MISRSLPRCAFWLSLLLSLPFAFREASAAAGEPPLFVWFCGLVVAQGFMAEVFGVRADPSGASFPRRMFGALGVPVFWRKRLPAEEISRVDPADDCAVRLFLKSGDFVDLILPSRKEQKKFLHSVGVARRG